MCVCVCIISIYRCKTHTHTHTHTHTQTVKAKIAKQWMGMMPVHAVDPNAATVVNVVLKHA